MNTVINKECLEVLNEQLCKGNKVMVEFNPKTEEIKLLKMSCQKIKTEKVDTGL